MAGPSSEAVQTDILRSAVDMAWGRTLGVHVRRLDQIGASTRDPSTRRVARVAGWPIGRPQSSRPSVHGLGGMRSTVKLQGLVHGRRQEPTSARALGRW